MSEHTSVERRTQASPAVVDEPIPNPGLPPHTYRPTDVDPKAERRAELQVVAFYVLAMLLVVGFVVAYFTFDISSNHDTLAGVGASTMSLGLTLGLALLFIGIGTIQWARKLMNDHEIVEMRHPGRSTDEDRDKVVADVLQGTEDSGITRRPLIRNTLLGALGLVSITPILALRDLGPLPGNKLNTTPWTEGMRVVVDVLGTPIRPGDMEIGSLVNGQPASLYETNEEGEPLYEGVDLQIAKSKASVILVKMEPEEIIPGEGRENWAVDGILCYSKICTHVGCPISLYERTTHHVLCPCHQSTFDLADHARVVFGPAARPLPQLPLALDDEGYLIAQSDFIEAVGPSFWERDTL